MAALQFAEAVKVLDGGSILEAARFYAKQNPNKLPRKHVPDVLAELLKAKQADGMSAVYLKDLRGRLGRFAESFKTTIAMVTTSEIEDFLRSLELSGRSRNNYRRAIATLFYFAETRGYVAKGAGQVESVALAKEDEGTIDIFAPAEMTRILKHWAFLPGHLSEIHPHRCGRSGKSHRVDANERAEQVGASGEGTPGSIPRSAWLEEIQTGPAPPSESRGLEASDSCLCPSLDTAKSR